jgi:hypothetical protein
MGPTRQSLRHPACTALAVTSRWGLVARSFYDPRERLYANAMTRLATWWGHLVSLLHHHSKRNKTLKTNHNELSRDIRSSFTGPRSSAWLYKRTSPPPLAIACEKNETTGHRANREREEPLRRMFHRATVRRQSWVLGDSTDCTEGGRALAA